MLYIGIDPDMHCQAFACIDEDDNVVWVQVLKIPRKLKGEEALEALCRQHTLDNFPFMSSDPHVCATESQQYYAGDKVPAQALISLATASGIVMGFLESNIMCDRQYLVKPKKWKGTVPKHIHQARTLKSIGIDYEKTSGKSPYCYPVGDICNRFPHLKKGDWKHISDAIGLAVYAKKQYRLDQSLAQYL